MLLVEVNIFMKKIWKSYKNTILLLLSLVVGAIVGLIFQEEASVLEPLGTLFMNMMFVLIIPLIFLTITTSIANIENPKRVGKLIKTTLCVFVGTSLVAVLIGIVTTYSIPLVDTSNGSAILTTLGQNEETPTESFNLLSRTVSAISVSDFTHLLSKENILALVIFSLFLGIAMNKLGKEAKPFLDVLQSANKVILKLVDYAFYYAPIGLGCYFAALIGTFGSVLVTSYVKTFVIYTLVALLFYFLIYSVYAYLAGGKKGIKVFWKHIVPVSATALSTCSSAASIPMNIKCAKNIGVRDDIAETVIPLGTSFHKDGSILGSVFKIMFLVYLFQMDVFTLEGLSKVLVVSLLANLLVTAVPVGGGTISEMVILSMMGFPVATLPILTIIATIIDAPATLLNVVGDTSSSMLVARKLDGKQWMQTDKNLL